MANLKVKICKGKEHDYSYSVRTKRIKEVGDYIVFCEPFSLMQVCEDCGHTINEYCVGGYIRKRDIKGSGDNG